MVPRSLRASESLGEQLHALGRIRLLLPQEQHGQALAQCAVVSEAPCPFHGFFSEWDSPTWGRRRRRKCRSRPTRPQQTIGRHRVPLPSPAPPRRAAWPVARRKCGLSARPSPEPGPAARCGRTGPELRGAAPGSPSPRRSDDVATNSGAGPPRTGERTRSPQGRRRRGPSPGAGWPDQCRTGRTTRLAAAR